ncbi:MAG: amino acid ABC transporter permease [Bacilli bacterium]|jgi:His/Glu/Gln/Arg/opine family amino acid ABC transporter permease subunit|nr:amino acid ABC transporter permease [Bacilli bacterium]
MQFLDISKLWDFSFFFNKAEVFDLMSGLLTTLSIALLGIFLGILVGILLAIGKLVGNKFIRGIVTIYINFVRGTPLLLQLYMMYYVPAFIVNELTGTGLNWSSYVISVIAIGLNSAAYVAEIFRAGITSVDKGQFEAASSLGFDYKASLRLIILPQAIKNIMPALGNEFIALTKETAIVSVIGAKDLMFFSKQAANITYNPFPPLFMAGILYFLVVYCLTKLVGLMEAKFAND